MPKYPPVTKFTDNVMNTLVEVANSRGITADTLDFDLLSYETYYEGTVDEEWQLLKGNDLLSETTEVEIRSSTFILRQEYEIRVHPSKPHAYLNLRFNLATDKYKSKIVAVIDPKSEIPLKQGVQVWIKEAIWNKQLRHGFMIGLYDQNLDKEINRLLMKIQKEGPLTAPYRLPVGEFFPPVPPIDDKVVYHYKNLKKQNNFIDGVKPGDLLLEYIFPKNGRDGRGCDGHHIAVPEPLSRHAGLIMVDEETITTEQDDDSIRFYARISGYVQRLEGVFSISQELHIESASLRETGSIEAGIDKEISLKVKKNEANEDSIGIGVNIDVQKLNVSGTVGAHAKIQACELHIGAQTHKKTNIRVTEKAKIHLHRGNLKAKEADIEILETGRVEADIVRVKKMVGGEIVARIIEVDTLYSNGRLTALESIEIQTIEGDGNNLIIDPRAIEAYQDNLEAIELEIRTRTSRLQQQSKEFLAKEISFKDKNNRIKHFQERVKDAVRSGKSPMRADIVRLQQYRTEFENLKQEEERLSDENEHLKRLKEELDTLYEADLHAVITHHGMYNGHTRVVFIDPKTSQEYILTPQRKATHIRLRREGDEKQLLLES